MTETMQFATGTPLTTLNEDEILFRDNVRRFAEEKIRPQVKEMDEKAVFDHALLGRFFHLGLMGIEIPEEYGGAGGKFFEAILAVEEFSRVDASAGVIVDVQNTLVANAILRWGNDEQKKRYLPQLATEVLGAYALSEAGSGSDAFALQTRAELSGTDFVLNGRKLWITNVHLVRNRGSHQGLQGNHGVSHRKKFPRIHRRQEGRQTRHSRLFHLRINTGRLPRSAEERPRRSGQGVQDCH
jgi:alkylation response protein AidB-like acyl-CoA dehydrogenase